MSFIHYKLITNKTFEKITFDGVSLSVFDLKKIIIEKKFRKQIAAPTPNGVLTTGNMPNKKNSDVDLEITNADTNEVYQHDTDLIPKNSRVRINRVVKTVGPAIAGGTITSTQKQKEQLVNLRERFNHYANSPSYGGSPNSSPLNDFSSVDQKPGDDSRDFSSMNDESNSNSSCSLPLSEFKESNIESLSSSVNSVITTEDNKKIIGKIKITIPSQKIVVNKNESPPPPELLCPFMDESGSLHLIQNAIIVPCCGYLICCEGCIRERINKATFLECPHECCIQEITSFHRLTPYKPIRQKVIEYLNRNPSFTVLKTIPPSMVVIQHLQLSSNSLTDVTQSSPAAFTPVKLNLSKPVTPESTELALNENLEITGESICDKDRSRSISKSTSSRSTSRSRSNSSSSSRMSSKSSTESVKTPVQLDETNISVEKVRRTPTPTVSEPITVPTVEQPQPQVLNQQLSNGYTNQNQQFNRQPFYGQDQQMFFNQQSFHHQPNYYRNYMHPQQHHQHMPGFGNFTKQVAPPPGTDHFIQSHFQQQHQQQIQGNFNQPQFNINQPQFQGQYLPIHQQPGFINNGYPINQYNQQWQNQQLPIQPGIINAPIMVPRQNYNQRQAFHPDNRSRSKSRSRSRSRHTKKHKRKYSRDRRSRSRGRHSRSRSRGRRLRSRSRSRLDKRSRVDSKKSSYKSRRSRSRSRSYHKGDLVKTNGNNMDVTNGSTKSSKHSKRNRSRSRDKHSKKSSREEKKEDPKHSKLENELVKRVEEQIKPADFEIVDVKYSVDINSIEGKVSVPADSTLKNKIINLKSSEGESSTYNHSLENSSPSKSKRKIFLRHEIIQKALQSSSSQNFSQSKKEENQYKDKSTEDLSEMNLISPINASSSFDHTVNEYEEFLDINVSENLSLA